MAEAAVLGLGAAASETFFYNRENFQYDRRMRQKMEYELADMRVEQAALWREDVKVFCALTPEKLEVYLLVIALELGFAVMAVCKARVPPGAPPWLVAMHTISVCGALMYLFLALWFGMHAFVSAQAYKVRILTQLVRLPIPTWRSLEASRTYSSAFEKTSWKQMLRIPFATGYQEDHVAGAQSAGSGGSEAHASGSPAPAGNGYYGFGTPTEFQALPWARGTSERSGHDERSGHHGGSTEGKKTADPWGYERSGHAIPELRADVNATIERQRHVWLMREAAKFYQTYDAFCRISMSAGTTCLANFFCYYCMTYVLTELAAPIAAWGGMMAFVSCALWLLRNDLMLSGREYFYQSALMLISPILSFWVTWQCSRHLGHPGIYKWMIVVALVAQGVSVFYNLFLFRVREMQTGAVLPTAFRRVLYIDAFGWAKHPGTWWSRLRNEMKHTRSMSFLGKPTSSSQISLNSSSSDVGAGIESDLPSMQCMNPNTPMRPEDVEDLDPNQAGATPARSVTAGISLDADPEPMNVSFRPGTFAKSADDAKDVQTGTDIHGEKPGAVPWRVFFVNTLVLAACWWYAAGVSLIRISTGNNIIFKPLKTPNYNPLDEGIVMPIPELFGERVETRWNTNLVNPVGLACDPEGTWFATSGLLSDGRHGVLHGRASSEQRVGDNASSSFVDFGFAPGCSLADMGHGPIQDLFLRGCAQGDGNCTAFVLPKHGKNLVACPLSQTTRAKTILSPPAPPSPMMLLESQPMGRAWLRDRGGTPLDGSAVDTSVFHPEEISSIGPVPCKNEGAGDECVVVGTTARRVLQMSRRKVGDDHEPTWVPQRLLQGDHGEVPRPGALALFGDHYVGSLSHESAEQDGGQLFHTMDLHQGGKHAGSYKLPPVPKNEGQRWASVCGGQHSIYAMADGNKPAIWRFQAPHLVNMQKESSAASAADSLGALPSGDSRDILPHAAKYYPL